MLALGPLAFLSPWVLIGLLSLPVIWWLLRVTPPAPQQVTFPPLRLLLGLRDDEHDTAHTPWWLLLLRLVIAALFILGLAAPVLNPVSKVTGSGPLAIVIDNSWAAASRWDERRNAVLSAISDAQQRSGRTVYLLPTLYEAGTAAPAPMSAADARTQAQALQPMAALPDRRLLEQQIGALPGDIQILWIADGVDRGGAEKFASILSDAGRVTLVTDPPGEAALSVRPPTAGGGGPLQVTVLRAGNAASPARAAAVLARAAGTEDRQGRVLARVPVMFGEGEIATRAEIDLPLRLRNQIAVITVSDEPSAGAVALLDDRFPRRRVGLLSGRSIEAAQPLLSDIYYLEKAIEPFAQTIQDDLDRLLESVDAPEIMILSDVGLLPPAAQAILDEWIERGGMLIRFAGPRLAKADLGFEQIDTLLPTLLRTGGRTFGGALTWETPQKLRLFPTGSPFAGLTVPDDVTVSRQVLAEPDARLAERTWARIEDGTPLVTAEQRGAGYVVLFHVTANAQWSTLPLSGLYGSMLQRLVQLAPGIVTADGARAAAVAGGDQAAGSYRPVISLDGFGRLDSAPDSLRPAFADVFDLPPTLRHPPGLYAARDRTGTKTINRAFNAVSSDMAFAALPDNLPVAERRTFSPTPETELGPLLLAAAAILLIIDMLAGLWLRGLLPARGIATAGGFTLALIMAPAGDLKAQDQMSDDDIIAATIETRLAYVRTGDGDIDLLSQAGLDGLTSILARRTAVEAAAPIGVDLESDEILFFPLVYWPILPGQPALSDDALSRVEDYLRHGGVILFDTRDQQTAIFRLNKDVTPELAALRVLLAQLDVPPLEPVPDQHVLTKAFYLLQEFPGRWTRGQVWVEASERATADLESSEAEGGLVNDGVSPIIIGGHDWAAAWAMDEAGRPLAELVPGGRRQRELAFRFGINLVMYALTGNYKADQVHIPTLLERLGQ